MAAPVEYDPRIAMVSTWRPPVPEGPKRNRRWPFILLAVAVVLAPAAAILLTEVVLVTDRHLPRIDRVEDYQPLATTQLVTSDGEVVAEVGGARRLLLAQKELPPGLAETLVAHVEPGFVTRPAIGQRELLSALWARMTGNEGNAPLSVKLARSLTREGYGPDDHGLVHLLRDWLVAIRMEFRLSRQELVYLYLEQISFGGGGYGIEHAAHAKYAKGVAALDAKQVEQLVAQDHDDPGLPPPKLVSKSAACGQVAVERLAVRYPPEVVSRLGARVVVTCDPERTTMVSEIIAHHHLDKLGLAGAAAFMRLPSHELVALVGGADDKHPIGALRAPFVIASALASLKWTAISPVQQSGMTLSLRDATARSPAATADALVAVGLPTAPVLELATRAGVPGSPSAAEVCDGRAPITLTDATELMATLATEGERREPVLLRSITRPGLPPEALVERGRMTALSPEATFLVGSMLSKPVRSPLGRPSAGLTGTEGTDTWLGLYTPDLVVVVWLGPQPGNKPSRGGEVERTAIAIGIDIVAAELKGKKPTPFKQPERLFVRRIDAHSQVIARGVPGGTPELFIPGSARREDMELAPEPDLDKPPVDPAP